ncbi:tRNA (adenosine(37)-N6)-threonylcarbamoyltransferase complex ATPase subunit type 1 TsaE [Actinocorallia lasiicapitis]
MRISTPEEMHAFGIKLAARLRPGDLLVLSGGLGAGKTTLTRGIGEGLGIRGPVTSPTFVIARVHPPLGDGPPLVHVDAYRLGGFAEVDDLDLDASLEEAVTIVEWGEGLVEGLAEARLELRLERIGEGEEREITLTGVGDRWSGAQDW